MTSRIARCCVAAALVIAACTPAGGNSDSGPTGNTPTASAVVGSSGGTVDLSTGAGVNIPPGAVPSNVTVTATAAPAAPPPPSATVVGTPVTFGPEGQQFTVPVTVTLAINTALLPAGTTESNVVIFTAPHGSTSFTALATTIVDSSHVSCQVTHFSDFDPAVVMASTDGGAPTDGGGNMLSDGGNVVPDSGTVTPDAGDMGSDGGFNTGCTSDTQCGSGQTCVSGQCVGGGHDGGGTNNPDSGVASFDAGTGTDGGVSTGCNATTDCGSGETCVSGQCVANGGPDGGIFSTDAGSANNPDSGAGTGCNSATDCPSGFTCNGGVCIPPAGSDAGSTTCPVCANGVCGTTCPSGSTVCNGQCSNTQIDSNNCGSCGNACASGEGCFNGTCAAYCGGSHTNGCASGPTGPDGGIQCCTGFTTCAGAPGGCADLTSDDSNCGACGTVCGANTTCQNSTCQPICPGGTCYNGFCVSSCPAGSTTCSDGSCANTKIDPNNCGACGTVCPTNTACYNGGCVPVCGNSTRSGCGASPLMDGGIQCCQGYTQCGAQCSDTTSDPMNCGGCGTACTSGEVCTNSVCSPLCETGVCFNNLCVSSCPTGTVANGAVCVDTNNDPGNCGAIGAACPTGEGCSNGTCAAYCGGNQIDAGTPGPDGGVIGGGCTTDAQCPTGSTCVTGVCQGGGASDGGTSGQSCQLVAMCCGVVPATEQAMCEQIASSGNETECQSIISSMMGVAICSDGKCVNIQNDPANCGGCGAMCPSGVACNGGVCGGSGASDAGTAGGGPGSACGTSADCQTGLTCNSGICGAPQSDGGVTCVEPTIACTGPQGATRCVNPLTAPNNCGGCNIVCATGDTCTNGVCTSTSTPDGGAPVLTALQVMPAGASLSEGSTLQLDAVAFFSDGSKMDVTQSTSWSSSNPAIATISATGSVAGVSAGTAQIGAQYQTTHSSVSVTVTSNGTGSCTTSADCAAGDACVNGVCEASDGGTMTCTAPNVECPLGTGGQACTDVTSDPNNCGGCGVSCNGAPCEQGVCQATNPDGGTGGPGSNCASATDCESGLVCDAASGTCQPPPSDGGSPDGGTCSNYDGGTVCTPAMGAPLWMHMDMQSITPGKAAGLNIGFSIAQAEQMYCQGTDLGDAFGDGEDVIALGGSQEVYVEYNQCTQAIDQISIIAPTYTGQLTFATPNGEAVVQVGQQITVGGAAMTLDWANPQDPTWTSAYQALVAAYATPDTSAGTCVTNGTCQVDGTNYFFFVPAVGIAVWADPTSANTSVVSRIDIVAPVQGSTGGPDAGPTCAAGQTMCATGCTDTTKDPMNCGGCGIGCPSGMCTASVCQSPSTDGGSSSAPDGGTTAMLKMLTITPANDTLQVGGTVTFTAEGMFSDGTMQDVTTEVMWRSSNPAVLQLNGNTGTGESVGTANVVALDPAAGVMATATVTVNAAP